MFLLDVPHISFISKHELQWSLFASFLYGRQYGMYGASLDPETISVIACFIIPILSFFTYEMV